MLLENGNWKDVCSSAATACPQFIEHSDGNMDDCKTSVVYNNGGCDSNSVGSGTGNLCYIGGGYTSGYWYPNCRRRSLLSFVSSVDTSSCNGKAGKPTGIVFTEDSKSGSWMLTSPDAVGLLSQLESLPQGEKVNWLKAKGAIFDPSTAF
ncbi:hypothetical protein R1flu_003095 [Riccia fluitans]|uniref:Uncharacterized protein n=1 Tax=Riccia fluitans TaxID=41844 RepID=A0ABD1Y811_9MARC